jgi:hypothetical protein
MELFKLQAVLKQKFGEDSELFKAGIEVYRENVRRGGPVYGIPPPYLKFWEPFSPAGGLRHITTADNLPYILRSGLEPRDPFPRPWAGMPAVYMGDPSDPGYESSLGNLLDHARAKGGDPVLLEIHTTGRLHRCIEPGRTFQVISLDTILPQAIKIKV